MSVSDYLGHIVVINSWASWCGPCRAEAPDLSQVARSVAGRGVRILGIDVRDNDHNAALDFVHNSGITYPSIFDPAGRSLLQLNGYPRNVLPSTIVLDKRHRVAHVFLEPIQFTDLMTVTDQLVAER